MLVQMSEELGNREYWRIENVRGEEPVGFRSLLVMGQVTSSNILTAGLLSVLANSRC